MRKIFLMLLTMTLSVIIHAQEITGVVVDQNGTPVVGANVQAKKSNTYTATDFDGNFSIKATAGEDLEFSMIGMQTLIVKATKEKMNVVMQEDVNTLQEVVVIGYGKQKKADLTGAISSVDANAISKTPSSSVNSALQGKVAGLVVTNTGAPGVGADIKLRGVGTITGSTSPLYVVDGMYFSNIDFLDPSNIKTINVLKDASSTAIFGVKGSGGVIIIETKSGGYNADSQFSYQGYTGVQIPVNVLKMANAEQFVTMAYESGSDADVDAVLEAMQRYGRSRVNPNVPDVNTDWYKETLQPALITNHNVNFTGGSSNTNYSLSANYFSQDGLLKVATNEYERFNLNGKLEAKVTDRLKAGGNFMFSNATQYFAENSVWNQIYFAVPILPVYDDLSTSSDPILYANAKDLGYRSSQNPFPSLKYVDNRFKKRSVLASIYGEYQLIPDKLTFKSSYNASYKPEDQRKVNLPYTMTEYHTSSIYIKNILNFDQIWDNTFTYSNDFGNHNVVLMGGTSFRDEAYNWSEASGSELETPDNPESWYLGTTDVESRTASAGASRFYGVSYFGRLQYNYKDKYLLNATFRAEGNNKYTNNPWGYFPGIGLGWVASEENFMQNVKFLNFLKFRASWGRNGNDKVPASDGSNTINVVSLPINDVQTSGSYVTSTYQDFKWEIFEETNVGLTARFLDNKMSLDIDYYIKDTKNAIIPVYQPIISNYIGKNAGIFRNSGLEVGLNWNNAISDNLKYNFGINFATLDNKAIDLYGQDYIDAGTAEFRQRYIVGEPLAAFYGYTIAGVYQNLDEINADPIAIANNLEPGDFKYVDQNHDGEISDDDRTVLGSYLPGFTYGGNFGMEYKNWDFSLSVYGQSGNKILNRKRGEVIWTSDQNMDADLAVNRWHGEGTSNTYTSSKGLRKGWNQKMSNFFVEDGSFFRIQNIQLGYNFKNLNLFKSSIVARIYMTAERPFTFFKYNGFSPEVVNSDNPGWDTQQYPVSSIYTLGLNLKI